MLYLHFIRHGETYFNRFGKMQGWSDTPLTEQGVMAVKETGRSLKGISFEQVITSDLRRTIETRDVLIQSGVFKENVKISLEPRIRETFFGSLEGDGAAQVYTRVGQLHNIEREEVFSKLNLATLSNSMAELDSSGFAENYEDFKSRIMSWLHQFISLYVNESKDLNVCVITHGNVIRTIVHNIDPSIPVLKNIENSSITIVSYDIIQGLRVIHFD